MNRVFAALVVVMMLVAIIVPSIPAHAQTGSTELTLTEAEINEVLAQRDAERIERLSDVVVDLQEDAISMSATFTGRDDVSHSATLSLIPQYVNERFVGWAVSELMVDGEADEMSVGIVPNVFTNLMTRNWRSFERRKITPDVEVLNVEITDNDLTYYFSEPLETPRGVDINLEEGTLSISEAELNALVPERMQGEDGPRDMVSDLYIDLQADQIVLSGTYEALRQDEQPVIVTLILAPTISDDGTVTWETISFEGFEMPEGADPNAAREALGEAWNARWFGRVSENFNVVEINVTDTELVYVLEAK